MMGGAGPSGGGGMPQMMVSVPAGVGPGQPFQVNANGQVLTIHCPPGVMAGQQIPVQMPPPQMQMQPPPQMQQMQMQMQMPPQQMQQMQGGPPVVMGAVVAGQAGPMQGGQGAPVAMAMPMQSG